MESDLLSDMMLIEIFEYSEVYVDQCKIAVANKLFTSVLKPEELSGIDSFSSFHSPESTPEMGRVLEDGIAREDASISVILEEQNKRPLQGIDGLYVHPMKKARKEGNGVEHEHTSSC